MAQKRRSSRSPVLLIAKIEVDGDFVPVTLRNLSSQGALIEGGPLPHEGTAVVFRRGDLGVRSEIVWTEGRFAGVRFERSLERDELLRQVPRPAKKFEPQFRRPGLSSNLSDQDRKMIQMWSTPLALRRD